MNFHINDCEAITRCLKNKVAIINNVGEHEINVDIPLSEYQLDSLHAVILTGELEELLNIEIDPTVIWDYPTIRELAKFLTQETLALNAA